MKMSIWEHLITILVRHKANMSPNREGRNFHRKKKKKRNQDLCVKMTKAAFLIQNINYLLECHEALEKRRFGMSEEPSNMVSSFIMLH